MKNLIILFLILGFTINCIDRIAPCNAGKICTYSLINETAPECKDNQGRICRMSASECSCVPVTRQTYVSYCKDSENQNLGCRSPGNGEIGGGAGQNLQSPRNLKPIFDRIKGSCADCYP